MASSPNKLPESYTSFNYDGLLVSHVPASSLSVTKVIMITLNRPKKYNAMKGDMFTGLEAIFNTVSEDPRVRAVVITGAGKAFSGGADLDVGFMGMVALKETEESMRDFRDWGGRVALAISNCKKPTIAAVNGPAAGVGLTMILPATIRVAYEGARCGFPFSRRGLVLESCSAFFLPRLIGLSRANHVVATGDMYPVTDPLVSGLFSTFLGSPGETVEYAVKVAEDLAENTSLVSGKLMRDMMVYCPASPEGAHVLDSRVFVQLAGTEDNVEGVKSFLERRKPEFTGSVDRSSVPFWPWWDRDDGRFVRQLQKTAKL
ncbi:ClpP/crotonase-like domain-containing protein [Colletotrichum acutatum]|uniref:ClpP/crotonase-like domain-containing protein n=1 Tax=Glomerella acutata TaxID=27357 RepID=A0AAD8ULG4_GLOAC|nr:ClpP/crotonase-like domain-containing protein [Colletotrichum acutatum]KAK1726452.1 ClpP/crotonase-like domain-containing protein [Colletotrichum acutatum]